MVPRWLCVELDVGASELALLLEVLLFVRTFTSTALWLLLSPLFPAVGVLDLAALHSALLLGGSSVAPSVLLLAGKRLYDLQVHKMA